MFDCFLAHVVIIFMQFLCCARIFFTKNSKIDSASILAPLALLTSLISFYIWGTAQHGMLLIAFSIIVFLTNGRSLFRLASRLYVDRYSPLFLCSTILELLIIMGALVFITWNRPVKISPEKFDAVKTVQRLTGNVSRGFSIAEENELKTTGFLYTFTPAESVSEHSESTPENNEPETEPADSEADSAVSETAPAAAPQPQLPVILMAGTDTAEICDYEPYLLFLAKKGYTVLAADLYSSELKYFEKNINNSRFIRKGASIRRSLAEKASPDANKADYSGENIVLTYKALTDIARKIYGEDRQFFFVTDILDYESIFEITENAGTQALGFYPLSKLNEYKTPGFGFIEQSDIPLAKKLGLARDKSLFIPRYAATKTVEELKALQL